MVSKPANSTMRASDSPSTVLRWCPMWKEWCVLGWAYSTMTRSPLSCAAAEARAFGQHLIHHAAGVLGGREVQVEVALDRLDATVWRCRGSISRPDALGDFLGDAQAPGPVRRCVPCWLRCQRRMWKNPTRLRRVWDSISIQPGGCLRADRYSLIWASMVCRSASNIEADYIIRITPSIETSLKHGGHRGSKRESGQTAGEKIVVGTR